MTPYSKNILADGFEMYMMKSCADNDGLLTLKERLTAMLFIYTNFMNDYSSSSMYARAAEERLTIWRAFLSGDRAPMREHIDSVTRGEKIVQEMAKEEMSDPNVRLRIAIYVIVTIVIVVLAFKAFGIF